MPSKSTCPAHVRTVRTAVPATAALVLALLAPLASTPRVARADADEDRENLRVELLQFVNAVAEGREEGDRATSFTREPARWEQVVAGLKRAGMKPDDVIEGSESFPFREAGARCKAYAQWRELVGAAAVIAESAGDLAIGRGFKAGEVDASTATTFGTHAAACSAAIERALAAGAPATQAVRIRDNRGGDEAMTLAAARTSVCDALASWAKTYAVATTAAKQAAADAAKKRYSSVGAGGDKLSWLVYYDPDGTGATWFLPGCKEEGDPRKLAKAPVLLRWTTADDGTHEIRRLQFKGNKLVKDTTRTFLTEGAARKGCK